MQVWCDLKAWDSFPDGGPDTTIVGYSDSDWASQIHHHSISGFAFFIGRGTVSWSSKKQHIITLSSTQVEYVALMHSSKDIIWIHRLLNDFSSIFSLSLPTTLHCDNQGTICLVLCRLRLKALSRPSRAVGSRGRHKPSLRPVTAHGSGFRSQKPEAAAQADGFCGLIDLYFTWIFPCLNFFFL